MDAYVAVLLDFVPYCRYAQLLRKLGHYFLGDVSILAPLSYTFSSFNMCLLYCLTLSSMEIAAQIF
jgi:hypothetical protein